ncbi:MAG TPA: radical SAM family heme chaperone HemW [Rhodanobacteraceae bacterium]|nr:radical SAM family heme chaperone HemW [Rhodanobacteraceae bacterium]
MTPHHSTLPPLSLYIHIPWCVRKCPYCDFNSHNAPAALPQSEYVDALLRDLDQDLPLAQGRALTSIFFGGGTPSLFTPDSIARILDGVAARLEMPRGIEVTLETNPGTVEHGPFAGNARAGVNRISFGVQSFDDGALRRIGRIHDAAQAERAVKQAQDSGITNLNLDLMYALPEQTMAGALDDVEKAILLQTPHLSHYQLTLEPNTAFAANPPPLPDDDSAWDMQEACQARIAEAGLAQYEVSAYARPGHECRHNLNYWHFGDYLGIGAGAHGKLTSVAGSREPGAGKRDLSSGDAFPATASRLPATGFQIRRRWKLRAPRGYLEHAASERRIGGDHAVPTEQLPFEFMLNAMRLNAGFTLTQFSATTGLDARTIRPRLETAAENGWVTLGGDHVRTTELGRRFLNDVIAAFLPETKPAAPHLHGGPPHD